jgi:hypothetical protein
MRLTMSNCTHTADLIWAVVIPSSGSAPQRKFSGGLILGENRSLSIRFGVVHSFSLLEVLNLVDGSAAPYARCRAGVFERRDRMTE